VKKRLDVLLVERGFAESRAQAQALVLAGLVRGYDKPGHQVDERAELEVESPPRFVSRGGEKLANALAALEVDPAGRDCFDLGASTGGFTDALLQHGAARVIAVDVGYGQLHPKLRNDPRVTVLERTNARSLAPDGLPYAPDLIVADVSFVSLRKALPAPIACAAATWDCLAMIKPQFEVGRERVGKGGVVRAADDRRSALVDVASWAGESLGASVMGFASSGLPGPAGNQETFVWLAEPGRAGGVDDLEAAAREVES
jgi:23S rRNA (cytidine1920-2'-O)/16S rRNA (cytidine1409-2'-O)-methyltransferase